MNIVFVCTGNICRSPMAQGLFEKLLERRGIVGVSCSSAGIAAAQGVEASPNAVAAAGELGADISGHRSRMLTRITARDADLIVCMTQGHFDMLGSVLPEEKIYILGGGIDDPYGGSLEVYRACAKRINEALEELAERIGGGREQAAT